MQCWKEGCLGILEKTLSEKFWKYPLNLNIPSEKLRLAMPGVQGPGLYS